MSSSEEQFRAFWKTAVGLAQMLVLGTAVVLYFTLDSGRALALGLLLGGSVSILRFKLRYRTLTKSTGVGALVRVRLFAYALSGLALGVAFACRPVISPWTTAAGLFAMNASVIAAELLCGDSKADKAHRPTGEGT